MNIRIVCVGGMKERYLRDAYDEYAKRLSRFCKLTVCELDEYKLPDGAGDTLIQKAVFEESTRILSNITDKEYVIALDISGKKLTSVQFSSMLSDRMRDGKSDFTFIIGGSCGYDDRVRKRAEVLLSFSDMTFPHQLFRIMLTEQVYRAFKIMNGEKYHK